MSADNSHNIKRLLSDTIKLLLDICCMRIGHEVTDYVAEAGNDLNAYLIHTFSLTKGMHCVI